MQELRIMMVLVTLSFEFESIPEELNNMDAVEVMFRKPQQCFVRLKPIHVVDAVM
jgi:hypothetical protein